MIEILLTLVIVGVLLYLVNTIVPIDSKIKTIINWFVIIVVVLWLLQTLGVLGSLNNIHVN